MEKENAKRNDEKRNREGGLGSEKRL